MHGGKQHPANLHDEHKRLECACIFSLSAATPNKDRRIMKWSNCPTQKNIVQKEGMGALFKGGLVRAIWTAPQGAMNFAGMLLLALPVLIGSVMCFPGYAAEASKIHKCFEHPSRLLRSQYANHSSYGCQLPALQCAAPMHVHLSICTLCMLLMGHAESI